ncbi:hypothetical protein K1T71_004913 [Dendrolimus kikuchii]|uniref:Uncharacterized protein n=1 Tax=Dendrolimus kikuchii TaxID=765133 RepID=A0ACC1D5R2_9NEOP|nr:hypothetical protein K1T71_004913 [Dendrolimus kikuchii]
MIRSRLTGVNEESQKSLLRSVKVLQRSLEVNFEDGKIIKLEDCWLRDNCRCSKCYNADTFQRVQHILEIPDVSIVDVEYNKNELVIKWNDGHKSTYTPDFLSQFDYKLWNEKRRLKPILWYGQKVADKVQKVHVDKFLNSEEGMKMVFQSLLDYGIAIIDGVDASLAATEVVCKALGGVQNTFFGGMWQFSTKADHADTAYTNLPLAQHNDSTYFTESTGLQVLHCLEHSGGIGGETTLADGFYGATCLRDEYPQDFEFLTTFDLEAQFIEEGHHYTYSAPVIIVDKKTQDLKQVRFNVYDRTTMAFKDSEECRSYYRSLRNLARYYENPDYQWKFKLKPGLVLVMDNFRVLHGRTGFSGTRVLCGSYVSRSDWLDKARTLQLIH